MKYLNVIIFFVLTCVVYAQNDVKSLASSDALKEVQEVTAECKPNPSEVLYESVSKILRKKGKALGVVNDDQSVYALGAASTAVPSNRPGFINSRNIAFRKAMLFAKQEFLRIQGEKLTSSESLSLMEDNTSGVDPDTQKKASFLQKVKKLADQSVDKALIKMGVSEFEVAKMNAGKKKAVYEEQYRNQITSLTAGLLKGISVVRICEGEVGRNDYQVAVVLKYSPENQKLAATIKGRSDYYLDPKKPSATLNKIMNAEPVDLIPRLGVLTTINDKGQMILLGYGQSEVRTTGSRQSQAKQNALRQARLNAVDNIKNFIAQDLVAKEMQENAEVLSEYANEGTDLFTSNKYETTIKSKTSTLKLSTFPLRQWTAKHPTANSTVAGVIVAWTPEFAEESKQLQKRLNTSDEELLRKDRERNAKKSDTPQKDTEEDDYMMSGDDEDF